MEMKDPRQLKQTLQHGDVRLPEMTGLAARGPSRAQVMLHLTGMGLGFLLLLVGLGLGLSTGVWNRLALIPVITGAALIAGWVTINYQFLSEMLKNRRVMVGTNALFMALLAVVLVIMVNFIGYRHYARWDMTSVGLNTLSPKSIQVLDTLDHEITILVTDRAGGARSPWRDAYERLQRLLRLYRDESSAIRVEILSPDVDPQATQLRLRRYGIEAPLEGLVDQVFVVAGGRNSMIAVRNMGVYAPNPRDPHGNQVLVGFKGEQQVTSAILEVITERHYKLYVLAGHGERSIQDAGPGGVLELAAALKRDHFQLEELVGVPDGGVPDDCDALIILDPRTPLAPREVSAIERYLGRGGRLFVAVDFDGQSGLESLLRQWGVVVGEDIVISQDARTLLGSPAAFLTSHFGDHEITAPLSGFQVAFNFARSVSPAPARHAQAVTLVSSSRQSYAETNLDEMRRQQTTTFNPAEDVRGPISVGVAVEETAVGPRGGQGEAGPLARMVVFGDADVFSNDLLAHGAILRNLDLCRNSIHWLVERTELISIEPQVDRQHILVVDAAGIRAVFWLMVVGLPLLVLFLGGIVWAVRSYGSRSQ